MAKFYLVNKLMPTHFSFDFCKFKPQYQATLKIGAIECTASTSAHVKPTNSIYLPVLNARFYVERQKKNSQIELAFEVQVTEK